MNIDEKAILLITKLVRKTSADEIKWKVANPPKSLVSATEDEIFTFFEANYKEKKFAIFERKSKFFFDEHEFYWTSDDVFAILDNNENVILEYSKNTPVLVDLFTTVREQVADLDNLIDDL
ncbi:MULTISPECIES: hypothetical protein [Acinetobacter]|uniref:Uncharacterized protein n=1 Tax=Acinetobacter baumannii TaxID=470 RepID=A0AAJ0QXL9_ACIBA|nr:MULTISPECIES: hypothetical protein [Acinetobacter]EHU1662493.1 hypothetical protein [Acinetobacter baumannii]EHU1783347.1 hypothetical protein [Acinetobacter baumannii]EHU1856357.1 hypothetical protein [Acinetobacter baumannii]EHU1954942.1 hypothetical protein [Acinetobacter baumannii]EHU2069089.1 hypothetical protein [Acinetobacter baumannii]